MLLQENITTELMETKELLNKGLEQLVTGLEKTEKFVLDQAPDISKQMIVSFVMKTKFNILMYSGGLLISLITFGFTLFKAITWYNVEHSCYSDDHWWVCVFVMVVVILCFIVAIAHEVYYLFYIKNCTKLFLLKRFKELMD